MDRWAMSDLISASICDSIEHQIGTKRTER
jgi:hypothetical protein